MEENELLAAFINVMLEECDGLTFLAVDDRALLSQIKAIHKVFACLEKGLRNVEGEETYLVVIKRLLAYENRNWPVGEMRDLTFQRVQTIIGLMQRIGLDVRLPELRYEPNMHRTVKDKLNPVAFSITNIAGHLTVSVEDSGMRWDLPDLRSAHDVDVDCLRAVLFAVTGDHPKHISGFSTDQPGFGYRFSADSTFFGIYFVEEGQAKRFFDYLNVKAGATLVVSEKQEESAFLNPSQVKSLATLVRQVVKDWVNSPIASVEKKNYRLQFPSE